MKHIYIVLIKAHTGLGFFARTLGGYDYTHIAVSFDESLSEFVTYSRKRHYLPLDAGFMYEYRDYYAFGKHRTVRVKVFKLPVKNCCYNDIESFIFKCKNDKEQMFNLFSMMTMPILHGFRIYKAHNCMSFTARIIKLSNCVKMKKPYYKYSIKDMDKLLQKYSYFEGYLHRTDSQGYKEYMEKPMISECFSTSIHTILALLKRMIFHSKFED